MSFKSSSCAFFGRLRAAALGLCVVVIAACGGGADAPPPVEGGVAPPVITTQPASITVTAGQPASFTVAATGTTPLAYQWQRNGADIAGATTSTYTLSTTAVGDSGAVFRAIVSNVAGTATSNDATLTATLAPPVLTITGQLIDSSVTAGSPATFTVAATCSAGTLNIQWQRNNGAGGAFVAIAGATADHIVVTPSIVDNGAKFRAELDCGGQSGSVSTSATLTVTAPGGATLDLLSVVGLRDQALLSGQALAIDQNTDGSFNIITANRIQKLSADLLSITPVVGAIDHGSADGPAASATFNQPLGLTHDAAGNVYVADTGNHVIRRIAPDGSVTTLAGQAGASGSTDGIGSAARFNGPTGIALGPDGDLYVADTQSSLIRRVTTAGAVTTYAGSTIGYADNATALAAQFYLPLGVAVAANGDVLVADNGNSRVRRILRNGNAAGAVQTLAGSGSTNVDASPRDGVGTAAVIVGPRSMVVQGNTLTLRDSAALVRQVDLSTAAVTTLTGTRLYPGTVVDGPSSVSSLSVFGGITTAPAGGFMLANESSLSSVSASGVVQTIANNNSGSDTPTGTGVLKQLPLTAPTSGGTALTVDSAGNVVIASSYPQLVRRVSPSGAVTLLGGLDTSASQMIDGTGGQAQFARLGAGLAHDSTGALYVADFGAVRKIDIAGVVTLLAGGRYPSSNGFATTGAVDGNASVARFGTTIGLAMGPDGNLYAADTDNFAIRRIDAAGNVTTVAGALGQQGMADGPSGTARFRQPQGIAVAPDGSLLVLDGGAIRRISADLSTVSTVDTSSVSAQISFSALAMDADGTAYFGTANGLWALRAGQSAATRLIPGGNSDAVVLGSSPHLSAIMSIAVVAPKQLVLVSGGEVLKATLP